jgi:hypothetical protein
MGGSCDSCQHRCCINGESGVLVVEQCSLCDKPIYLCSNELSEKELKNRCNGEACGCGDFLEEKQYVCNECSDSTN